MARLLIAVLLVALASPGCSPGTEANASSCDADQVYNPVTGACEPPGMAPDMGGLVADTGGESGDVRVTPDGSRVDAGADGGLTPDMCVGTACVPTPTEVCDNDVDDDRDGLRDCDDPDCRGQAVCRTENCSNGRDDDSDGDVDCLDEECASTADCGSCLYVPTPEVAFAPLPAEPNPGRYEMASQGRFTDDYVYNAADTAKIGTRREWGGTVVFYGLSNASPGINNTNVIDANDTGREVQVAFYDPDRNKQQCAWNGSCRATPSTCPNSIQFLGWNPVQGGNLCNNGSGIENVDHGAGALTVSALPLFWNPDWDQQDCVETDCRDSNLNTRRSDVRIVQKLRFVREHVVELEYSVQNLAAVDHAPTGQEFPTVYTANGQVGPDLWRLFGSNGSEITIDQPGNDGFKYKAFTSPGGWVSMQNDDLSYGVGHYTENRLQQWTGWQLRSLPFNNFRPQFVFGVPANGSVNARSYLILGSQATVGAEAAWLDQKLPPFGVIDAPTVDQVVTGASMTVRGWTLDNKGVQRVEAVIDSGAPVVLGSDVARPDVCLVWPKYPECDGANVGYAGAVDIAGLSACAHLLEVRAVDSDGNSRVVAARRFVVE